MTRIILVIALVGSACTGSIGDPVGMGGGGGGGGGGGAVEFAPAPATLHRLTVAEYQTTVRDLFGPDIAVPTDLEVDTRLHGFATVGASELTISPRAAEQYEAAALSLAGQMFADEARGTAFVGCVPATTADPCIRDFLRTFGRRIWRRPLGPEEVDQLAELARAIGDSFGDPFKGLSYTVASMLESPYFLFRVERGEIDPDDPTRRRFDSWEMASRLSYLFWSTTPDDELLDAAEDGSLVTDEGIRAQAERLIAAPRARLAIGAFWNEFLSLERLDDLDKDVNVYPQMSSTLGASMRGEIERIFTDVVFDRNGDFREIFDTRTTFVNQELAALYGLPDPAQLDFVRVDLPEESPRGGLMGTAAILSLYAHAVETSPTLRGKFIRVNLMCEDIPPPPPGVETNLDVTGGDGPRTMRQKLEVHRTNPTCAGCHDLMDPIGLSLEHFDAIGAFRDTDDGMALDTTATLDGTAFDGARQLGALLRENASVGACVARRLYRHGAGHLEIETEQPAIEDLGEDFGAAGYRFQDLLLELVQSEGFRTASLEAE